MASGMSTVGAGDDYPDPDQADNHADHDEESGVAGSGMACLLWERGTREATDRSDLTPCLHRPDHDDDQDDDDQDDADQDDADDDQDDDDNDQDDDDDNDRDDDHHHQNEY